MAACMQYRTYSLPRCLWRPATCLILLSILAPCQGAKIVAMALVGAVSLLLERQAAAVQQAARQAAWRAEVTQYAYGNPRAALGGARSQVTDLSLKHSSSLC